MDPADPTSLTLLLRAKAREPEAWQRLVTLYSPLVIYWCRQTKLPESDLPDVVQEVFAAVASSLSKFRADREGVTFRGWMRGITRHKLQDHFRRCREGERGEGGSDVLRLLGELPAPAPDVELSESPAELAGLYHRALTLVQSQFEQRTWQAFWQVTIENRTPTEVASQLGITPNAVRKAKSRILRCLKDQLGELIA